MKKVFDFLFSPVKGEPAAVHAIRVTATLAGLVILVLLLCYRFSKYY